MTKIISFSLWGDNPLYWTGALENIKLAEVLYPGWKCRFYIDEESDQNLIRSIEKEDCEVVFKRRENTLSGLLWRFFAADATDIMISRDADSRLSLREVQAVNDWLASDKNFHIMRDHPQHTTFIPGGMWGCRNMEGFIDLIKSFPYEYQDIKGHDQFFLATRVYPQVKDHALIHDSYNLSGDGIDFPMKRIDNEFVGARLPI